MASQQSSITSTSTTTKQGQMPPPKSTTVIGKKKSSGTPTASTQAPFLTDAVQKCVDTAAEVIAIHREAKLIFMQGVVKRILREAYREPTNPPSVGTLTQSVFAGVPPPTRPTPYFVAQPNYHNGQFHPPRDNTPISHSPNTSVHTSSTHSPGMDTSSPLTPPLTTTPSTSSHSSSCAAVPRSEAQKVLTLFGPIALVESLTKTQHLLVADINGELQTLNNQLSSIPIAEIRNEQNQTAEKLNERMEALEKCFNELKDITMIRTNQSFTVDPALLEQ